MGSRRGHRKETGKEETVFVQISKCIRPNCKMHFLNFQNTFVQFKENICPSHQIYLSACKGSCRSTWEGGAGKKVNCICSNHKEYLSKFKSVFVQIITCICFNCKLYIYVGRWRGIERKLANRKLYLSKLNSVFVQITTCICFNCKLYVT